MGNTSIMGGGVRRYVGVCATYNLVVANRLDELEKEGLVSRKIIESRPPKTEYRLTKKGKTSIELMNKIRGL